MKNYYLSIAITAFIAASCGSTKKAGQADINPFPALDQYEAHALSIPKSGGNSVKLEIIPGKTMEVDCNRHFLSGVFTNKQLSDGNSYYVFDSNGNAVSTRMACPDNSTHKEFVQGQSVFVDEGAPYPSVVYASKGIEIGYRLWLSSPDYAMGQNMNNTLETEATKALSAYPEMLNGYKRYILILPEIKDSQKERKIEIIPGITENVDCNQHRLMGQLVEKNIEGWGYDYLIFESDGTMRSTRMACPDTTHTSKFVTGETKLLNYNSRLPIVVFVPEKEIFSVRYKVWEAGELMR